MSDKKRNWFARHKVWTVVIVFIVLIGVGGALGGNTKTSNNNTANNGATNSSSSESQTAKVNQAVRDGKFEFTVTSLECGKSTVGTNQYMTKTAQGQFCVLSLTVKNIGNEAQGLFSANQYLLSKDGQKYSADDTATLYNTPDGNSWYANINPGNSVSGAIVFDVPKGVTPTVAELHDSAYSGGVKVSL